MDTKRPILVFIITIFFSVAILTGATLQESPTHPEVTELSKDFREIFKVVDENYVDPIDRKKIFIQAVSEIATLDQYSSYLGEESFATFEENIDGDFVSIGIEFIRKIDHLLVTDILPFSSASGILKFDDRIYFLNKQAIEGLNNAQISVLLRGPVNSELTLGVRRGDKEDLIEVVLKRKEIKKSPIRFTHMIDLEKKVGYMYIELFNNHLSETFTKEYLKLINGVPAIKSIIIDFRGNPGGGLESAVAFCDLFLKSGLIVATVGNENGVRGIEEKYMATPKFELPLVPMLIMVDRESASAAELTAGCLQDYKIAKIFGEKSYGKGEAQTSFPLYSKVLGKYGIKLTTSKFYTKSGFEKKPKVSISGIGVAPDFVFDFGFQDNLIRRGKRFDRAWGLWNQALAEKGSLEDAREKSKYFLELADIDPGLKKAIEIISKMGDGN